MFVLCRFWTWAWRRCFPEEFWNRVCDPMLRQNSILGGDYDLGWLRYKLCLVSSGNLDTATYIFLHCSERRINVKTWHLYNIIIINTLTFSSIHIRAITRRDSIYKLFEQLETYAVFDFFLLNVDIFFSRHQSWTVKSSS